MKTKAKYVIAALVAALTLSALSIPALAEPGGVTASSDFRFKHAPPVPVPPKPFYLQPEWINRVVPHTGGGRHWAIPYYIVACESGGNYRAQNPSSTASGAYQMLDTTWLGYGGGRYASRALYAEYWQQDQIAHKLYQDLGPGPWVCG